MRCSSSGVCSTVTNPWAATSSALRLRARFARCRSRIRARSRASHTRLASMLTAELLLRSDLLPELLRRVVGVFHGLPGPLAALLPRLLQALVGVRLQFFRPGFQGLLALE